MALKPEHFGLKTNPFHILVTDEEAKHWAGMPEIKDKLEDVFNSVLPEDIGASEFIIILSPWGGGKTHALRYFEREIRDKEYGYAFYVGKVRLGQQLSFLKLFQSIIRERNDEFFKELVEHIVSSVDKEVLITRKQKDPTVEATEVIAEKVPENNRRLVSKIYSHRKDNNVRDSVLLDGVSDDFSAASMMASLISVMTSPIGSQEPRYRAAYLFLDEMEDVLDAAPAQSFSFWSACRELINRVGENFALVFSFSSEAALLEAQIPPYLMTRLTRPYIEIRQLVEEDALKFIRDFLQGARLEGFSPPQPYYPFCKETIDLLLEREPETIPRNIIMGMRRVFERAIRGEKIDPNEGIPRQVAEEILDRMGV